MTTYVLDTRTATPHFPGIGRYTSNLARELPTLLTEQEHLIQVGLSTQNQIEHPAHSISVHASPFSLAQQWQIPALLRTLPKSKIQNPKSKTLYHSPYYLMPYFPGVPTVLTFYDALPLTFPHLVAPRARWLFRLTTRLACRAARQIVAISEASRRELIEYFAIDPAKVTTTPLAPDPRFQPQTPSEIDRVRQKYALPDSFILYFGINKPHKNLTTLIDAVAGMQERHNDKKTRRQGDEGAGQDSQFAIRNSQLIIAGAWDTRYPEAKERAEPLGEAVRFLGRIEDMDLPGLYAAATVFVFPSRTEGFGLPVLEAMACGTPVTCSNRSSLPEVAGDAALLFDPNDPAQIAESLYRLLDDTSLRTELHHKGINQAARFTWKRTAEVTLDVYRNVVHRA